MEDILTTENARNLLLKFCEEVEERHSKKAFQWGIPTGFYDLDSILGGLHASELTVIAGRHSMGKTAFAINLMNNIITQKRAVLYVSYEMNDHFIASRMVSSYAGIDNQKLNSGCLLTAEWEKFAETLDELAGYAEEELIHIISGCTLDWKELFEEIRFFAKNNPNGVVIIDYFQLIRLIGDTDRITELSTLAGAFKRLAIELEIPIILVSEVVKKSRDSKDKRPRPEDLAECDALAQHSDNVVFLYRKNYYYEEEEYLEINSAQTKGEVEIIVAKQKNGPTGVAKLLFLPEFCKFKNPT